MTINEDIDMRASPHQFSLLCTDRITELQKSLELIVLGERDYLHDCAKLGENLTRQKLVERRAVNIL